MASVDADADENMEDAVFELAMDVVSSVDGGVTTLALCGDGFMECEDAGVFGESGGDGNEPLPDCCCCCCCAVAVTIGGTAGRPGCV